MKIPVYIFTYNRLQYLQNAIQSVEKFYPYETIYIVDDGSDDPEMLSFIEKNKNKYEFIFPNSKIIGDRGGLYSNLNYCMNHAKKNDYDYVLMMFDDLQIVRNISSSELEQDAYYLKNNSLRAYGIVPSFFPITEKSAGIELNLCVQDNYYVAKKDCTIQTYNLADVGVVSVRNFFDLMKKFEINESLSQKKCREKNLVAPHSWLPIGSRLPFQEYKRRGRNPKAIELLNVVSKRGFYPFNDMTELTVEALANRNRYEFPYAENWLHAPGVPQDVWSFWGESFGIELLGGEDEKLLAEKLFWIENNVNDFASADKMIIALCEEYLNEKQNTFYSYN